MQKVTFEATTAKELKSSIHEFCKEFGVDGEHEKQAPLPLTQAPTLAASTAAAPAKKGPGRPPKAPAAATSFTDEPGAGGEDSNAVTSIDAAPAAVVHAAPAAAPIAAAGNLPPNKQAVTDALTKVNSTKGLTVCREILAKFGTDRLSSLPAEKYPAFLEACNVAMA